MISDTSSQEEQQQQQQQQQQDPSSSASSSSTNRPNNTLKNRIMMAMETTTTTSNDNDDDDAKEVHISSVLAAASALASLGNQGNQGGTPPSPSTLVDLASGLESEEHAVKSFPQKLHEILSTPEYTDIITWLPRGRGFIILQKRQFASEIMPACFKHGKFTSFTRKLNRWNFTRVTRGSESGAYYHKYFRRDEPDLCLKMHCHSKPPSKDNNMGSSSSSSKHGHTRGGSSSPLASPGVSSAMTRLKLLESSPYPAAARKKPSESSSLFSTSNPEIYAPDLTPIPEVGRSTLLENQPSSLSMSDSKIYAPDLTRRTENATTTSFPSATSRQRTNRHNFQMHAHQAMLERNRAMLELKHGMLLKTNGLMLNGSTNNHNCSSNLTNKLRQQQQIMTNGNNFFSQQRESNSSSSGQHHSQGRPSSFASYNSRQHLLVMHEAMNALRRKQEANDSGNDLLAMPTLRRQQNMPTDKATSNSNDPLGMPTLQRQQNMPYTTTDKAYLDWLRSKNPDPSGERFVSALEAALGSPEHTRAMIREVMKARTAEYETRRAADTVDDGERKPAASAVKMAVAMDRKQVANVYGKTNKPSKEDYPKAVRRASAA